MKKNLLVLILSGLMSVAFSQDIRFGYTVVNNGTTSEIRISVVKFTVGTENMAGFTSNLYYNSGESTISSFDTSPATALGWAVDQGATPNVVNINTAIPIAHTGFATINVIDLSLAGTNVGQSPLQILTIILDNTPGTAAQSPVYLASSSENHPALEYVGNDFLGHPVIVQPGGSLPVELLDFSAEAMPEQTAFLKWITSSETNSKGFEIERAQASDIDPVWEAIGWVEGAGTTTSSSAYDFTDFTPHIGENLYRLKLVDINGAFSYSNIKTVRFSSEDIHVYPNPATDWIQIDASSITEGEVEYNLFDVRGSLLKAGILYPKETNRVDLSQFADGIYVLQILLENRRMEKRIVKGR